MNSYDAILEEIFTSIHLITDRKIAQLMLDRSVIVQIVSRDDETKNLYRVSYQGVEYDAYSLKNDSFNVGEEVYMLVPDNNFSNKKILISRSAKIAEAINTGSGGGSFAFGTISVSGQSAIVAEVASDTLTIAAGSGITLTTNATTDTLTIAASAATPGDGTLSLAVSGIGLSGSATFKANQTSAAFFTVSSNATSSNVASTIVSRDSNGSFAATTVSGNLVGTASNATNLNNQSASYYLDYTNLTNKPTISDSIITVTSGGGLTGSGTFSLNQSTTSTITLSHLDTSNVTNVSTVSSVFVNGLTFDTYGHVLTVSTASQTVSDSIITIAGGSGLTGSGTFSLNQSATALITVSHNDTSNVSDVSTASNVFINGLTFDTFGHVLSVVTASVSVSGGGGGNAFGTISVSGQSAVVADTTEDILTFVAGTASIITTNATTDTVTFAVDFPAIRVTGFTSTGITSWASTTAGGFSVKKDIAIAGVTTSDYPEVAFNLSTYAIAQTALITYVETYAGGITLYGVYTPSSTVSFDYVILKG